VRQSLWAGRPRRPPRAELGYRWQPEGTGCADLFGSASEVPPREDLVRDFCARWRGRSILFVGDSTSATAFASFAHLVGIVNTSYNTANPCYHRKTSYGPAGKGSQEIDLKVQLCEAAPGGVRATFLRNEDIELKRWGAERDGEHGSDRRLAAMLCAWGPAFEKSDFTVLNTGLHHHGGLSAYAERVNATFAKLAASIARRGRDISRHVLYRSTWAAVVGCGSMSDPLTPPQAAATFRTQSGLAAGTEDRYNWTGLSPQNTFVRRIAESYGIPFWDTYPATLMRPGGHRPNDCVHYWLPGPPDGLTLQMLAYLNLL